MADRSSLLLPSPNLNAKPDIPPHVLPAGIDEVVEKCIGTVGRSQILQAIIVSFVWFFDAQQVFISIFTDTNPKWHCTVTKDLENCYATSGNRCNLPENTWVWDRPSFTSTVSEWELDCYAGGDVSGVPASAFFVGCVIGGFVLATLGDSSIGRKKMLWSMSLVMSVAGILVAFSPNVWVYTSLRFITGFARATLGTSALVLSTEIIGKKWRGQVTIVGFSLFTLGFLSLPIMAFSIDGYSWRILYLLTSVPCFFYSLLIPLLVYESPRWLLLRGRRDDAIATLKSIASSNGHSLTTSYLNLIVPDEVNIGNGFDLYSALKLLIGSKWASRRLAAIMTAGFGIGMLYYGLPIGVESLGFNLYLSVTYNALAELPSSLLTLFFIDNLNRRKTLLITTLSTGGACLLCSLLHKDLPGLAAEVVAFFGTITAFDVILIYTLELFPTCVRNSAVAMVRQAVVLGGVLAPIIIATERDGRGSFSFAIFGVVIGFCGMFVCWLPETRGVGICDTMEEQESKEFAVDLPSESFGG